MEMKLSKFWEIVKGRGAWYAAVHGVTKSQTGLSNWTATAWTRLRVKTPGGSGNNSVSYTSRSSSTFSVNPEEKLPRAADMGREESILQEVSQLH